MPAACPGDPDYPADELPLTRECVEAEFDRLRRLRAPLAPTLREARADPEQWDAAVRAELHGEDADEGGDHLH